MPSKVEKVVDEAAVDGGFSKDEAEAIKEAVAEEVVEAEPKPKPKKSRKKVADGPTAEGRTGNYVPADSDEYKARAGRGNGRANYIP